MNATMRVTVHYMAQLKRAAGAASEIVEMQDGGTVAELLARLTQGRDGGFRNLVVDGGDAPHPSLLVFVNDEQARGDRLLRDGDQVTLLTPMSGG
jgi:molybdopterin converting factor small subunit